MAAVRRKIELPPAVTNALWEGLGFLGRQVAHGVSATKASTLREAARAFREKADECERAADALEGRTEPRVVDATFEDEQTGRKR